MTGRTHDAAAITLLGVAVALYPIHSITLATALVAILANQIGGIMPDIDQPTAPFWRNLPIGGFFGRFADKLLGGHRFLTHSLLGAAAIAYLAHWLLVFISPLMPHVDIDLVWWAFIVGLISHLLMDTFTKEGVPWLLPVPIKFGLPPIKALRVTTGKFVENLIIFPGLILIDVWLVATHYHDIVTFIHARVGS
ncbi:MAG: Membrane protein containing transrane [Patescibacteria group bacterium]|nr:Membrane protein containing transrane [Patescibacteria group bacterium]